METLQGMKRTHHCGALRKTDVGQDVVLCGWVSRRRDHGGLIFVDMRDRSGFVQVVFDEAAMNEGTFHKAESLRNEFCIAVRGKIRARSEETINPNIETGEIEVVCAELRILNPSKTPPFYIQDGVDVDEMVRKALATSSSRAASTRASSTRCRSPRRSSSRSCRSPASRSTSRSSAASAMRTCALTASRSSPRWTRR